MTTVQNMYRLDEPTWEEFPQVASDKTFST
jgi:hypothetical protein